MKHLNLMAAALAAAGILSGSAAVAAEVQISGLISAGLYYTNPQGADGTLAMAGYKEAPWDPTINIKGQEDLGNGLYAGFHLQNTFTLDTGSLAVNDTLFTGSRLFVGNDTVEVSFGRIANFTCATKPYSVYAKLKSNQTFAGMAGIAPANITFNAGDMDNAVAFATKADKGFFLQGIYSNGKGSEETTSGWSDNNHVGQLAFGWVGERTRLGTVLSWEMPDQTAPHQGRKENTFGVHLIGGFDFAGLSTSLIYYHGENDWRLGGAPDLGNILTTGSGANNFDKSEKGMRTDTVYTSIGKALGRHYISGAASYTHVSWEGNDEGMRETKGSVVMGGVVYYYNFSKRTRFYAMTSYSDGDKLLSGANRLNQWVAGSGVIHTF